MTGGNMESSASLGTPTLYFNSGLDDEAAYRLIRKSNILCNFEGPVSSLITPAVFWDFREYRGLERIRRFIKDYRKAQEEAA